MERSWREFVAARMMRMDAMLEGLTRDAKEMWRENTEDRQEYFRKVGKVQMDVRVRRIVEWVEEKKSDEELEDKLENGLEDEEKEAEAEMESEEKVEEVEDGVETEKNLELEGEKKTEKEMEKKMGDGDVEMEE